MKLTNSTLTFIIFILLSGCSTLSVDYDFNQKVDFTGYNKFSWLPFPENMKMNEFNRTRFVAAVESSLAMKGFNKDTSNPDFVIAVHFGKENKVNVTNRGYSYAPNAHYGGYGYRHRDGYSGSYSGAYRATGPYATTGGVSVYEYELGTLILDIVDAETKELIWRATASAVISPASTPDKQTKKIKSAVNVILENFPPKNKP